jgi:hypothetical protein
MKRATEKQLKCLAAAIGELTGLEANVEKVSGAEWWIFKLGGAERLGCNTKTELYNTMEIYRRGVVCGVRNANKGA